MTDAEREERAVWKLAQGGYHVRREQGRYLVTNAEQAEEVEDLTRLVAFARSMIASGPGGRSPQVPEASVSRLETATVHG